MEKYNIKPNDDNDLMFRESLIDQLNKQKRVDQLVKIRDTLISEDTQENDQLQYFTE